MADYTDGYQVCSPWTTPDKLCCEGDQTYDDCVDGEQPLTFEWTDEDLILAASNLLYNRTGQRWPGLCEREVWPCLNCTCRRNPCCGSCYEAIMLQRDFPIQSIDAVEIDGVPLAPADYRLDEHKNLVRTDGLRWPLCNDLGLPLANQCAEVRVSYTTGRVPPIEGQIAAAELACEMKKACNGESTCKLPDHVRSLSRRGVSMELQDVAQLLQDGMTGNPHVDRFLEVHGRSRKPPMLVDPVAMMRDRVVETS